MYTPYPGVRLKFWAAAAAAGGRRSKAAENMTQVILIDVKNHIVEHIKSFYGVIHD